MMKNETIKIHPSIMAGDWGKMADEAKRIEDAGADAIHLDVMDGHFVPNLTMGPSLVAAVNQATDLTLDVHLMIYQPFDYIERFVEAGADSITFHFEATEQVEDTLLYIRKCNVKAGLAFCPETSESFIPKYLDKCDLLLLMTVHPGFGGQEFIPEVLDKVRFARDICDKLSLREGGSIGKPDASPPFTIQVDGGINDETAPLCIEAGANVIVSGSHLFNSPDLAQSVRALRG